MNRHSPSIPPSIARTPAPNASHLASQDWLRRKNYEVTEETSYRLKWAEYVDVERRPSTLPLCLTVIVPTTAYHGTAAAAASANAHLALPLDATLDTTIGELYDQLFNTMNLQNDMPVDRHAFKVVGALQGVVIIITTGLQYTLPGPDGIGHIHITTGLCVLHVVCAQWYRTHGSTFQHFNAEPEQYLALL